MATTTETAVSVAEYHRATAHLVPKDPGSSPGSNHATALHPVSHIGASRKHACGLLPGCRFRGKSPHVAPAKIRSLDLRPTQDYNPRWCTRKSVHQTISASIDLKPPPYALDALEPHMSKSTLEYHWGKHHRAYVNNLNNQIKDTELDEKSLESIILASYNNGDLLPTFNNAAQIWNHEFFWESMKPNGGGKPSGELLELIERDFGSFEGLINELKSAAATQFGSGWAWLVYKEHKLAVLKTTNAINPLVLEYHPLLTIDVWEHSYYLDFQNRRPDYISTFLDKLVSWETVSVRLKAAKV